MLPRRRPTAVAASGIGAIPRGMTAAYRTLGFTSGWCRWRPRGRSSTSHPSWPLVKPCCLNCEIPTQRAGCVAHKSGSVRGPGEQSPGPTRRVPPTTTATAALGGPAAGNGKPIPDPAVSEKPVRRRFTAEYKLRSFTRPIVASRPATRASPPRGAESAPIGSRPPGERVERLDQGRMSRSRPPSPFPASPTLPAGFPYLRGGSREKG